MQSASARLAEFDSANYWKRRLGHISEGGIVTLMR